MELDMENVTTVETSLVHPPIFVEVFTAPRPAAEHIDQFMDSYLIGIADRLGPNLPAARARPSTGTTESDVGPDINPVSPAKQERLRLNRLWQVLARFPACHDDPVVNILSSASD